jgi:putative ABC transport system ATP-binding protein
MNAMNIQSAAAVLPTTASYELHNVARRYGSGNNAVEALRAVSLHIDASEFVAVVGPSGSGKTTLLQLLGALDRPSSGSILCRGRDLAAMSDGELSALRLTTLGFVFQQFNLVPTLSAQANVEAALAPAHRGRVRADRAVDLLAMVGLANRGRHLPSQLSGGEQQRVAIARALANDPAIILADEPTGNLDSTTGKEIMGDLRRLADDGGKTVIVVTHDDAIAASAQRVIRIRDGSIED